MRPILMLRHQKNVPSTFAFGNRHKCIGMKKKSMDKQQISNQYLMELFY